MNWIKNNPYLIVYIICKVGMFYTMFNNEWLAFSGYTIATTVSYIETMRNLKTK